MMNAKKQNAIVTIGVGLLILLGIYALTGAHGSNTLAYPAPNQSAVSNGSNVYPGPISSGGNLSAYPAPGQSASMSKMDGGSDLAANSSSSASTLQLDKPDTPRVMTSLTIREGAALPEHRLFSPNQEQIKGLQAVAMSRIYDGPLPSAPPLPNRESADTNTDLVDNWELLFDEDFEGMFPQSGCVVYDTSNDGYDRKWDDDDFRPLNGSWAGWPANGGADGVDPASSSYPANLRTWLICGPFDLSQADKFMVQFAWWLDIDDPDDYFFYGVSTDGTVFDGTSWHGDSDGWYVWREHIQGVTGDDSVWVGWSFESDGDLINFSEGAWIDDLEVWRYNMPDATCGDLDPGDKGMVLPPYDPTASEPAPMIRAGDTLAVDKLKAAGVDWVRLGFIQQNGIVDLQEYDRMIDTLCAEGISVAGLVNSETLLRQDYDDSATATAYRQEFTSQVEFIADYYEGRITYWEVWNEQNHADGAYVNPIRYAPLLDEIGLWTNLHPYICRFANAKPVYMGVEKGSSRA